jgi:predicted secreted protein
MSIGSALAVYFIIWWAVLFAVLPIGVRNAHEAGEEVEPGNEPGAPVNPNLLRKAIWTTFISGLVFVFVYFAFTQDWFSLGRLAAS